jgi:SecD/SecF fusion protein
MTGMDESGWPDVHFAFKGEGSQRMGALTGNNINRQLAIILDDTLLSHANIKDRITERGQITGKFTQAEVEFVVRILKAGSLPATLQEKPVYEDPSDPTLGAENIQKGFQAVMISLIAVFAFTFWYYRFAGFVACFALAFNILLTVAVMILFGATLTMPGLAGLVLTVGMSVDSNVLIFERLREELAKGASLRMAIRNGFERAMTTIIDSNLTTLLTALILYIIGTDQLVGFAVTLILGIITSMFTAIFVSRVIFEVAERTGFTKTLNMTQLFASTNFDFVAYQWNFITASLVFIAVGLAAAFYRGGGIFDIDLRGGTSIQVTLKENLSDTEMRAILDKAFAGKTYQDSKVDYTLKPVKAADANGKRNTYRVDSIYPETDEVQKWLTEALVDDKGESLLKFYRVEFEPVAKAGEKQGAQRTGDEATFFTSLNQNESEKAAEKAEPKVEAKAAETQPEAKAETAKTTEEKAPEEKAPAEAKTEEKKAEEPPVTKAAGDDPTATPGEKTPETKPAEPRSSGMVTHTMKFSDNAGQTEGIDAQALKTRIEEAAKALNIDALEIVLDNRDWDKRSQDVRFSEWNVSLSTSPEDSQKILSAVQTEMGSKPIWAASKKIGGQIAGNFVRIAFFSIVASLVGIVLYIWVRFQNVQWGFAAVLALVHDVLCMLSGIALSYWLADALGVLGVVEFKIDLTVVAAFLTLIGYSINDTIVVFDRMREVKGKMPNLTKQVVNDSINQTLSRTVLTFFTTFMVVVVLYAAGGNGIHGFAFAMLIGTVVGVYSSIYIAAPFLLWMIEAGEKSAKKPF